MLAKLQKLSGLHQAVYYQSRAWESWESLISVPGVLGLMLALYLEGSEGRRLARATMIESQGEGSQNLSKAALLPCGMARIQEFTRPNGSPASSLLAREGAGCGSVGDVPGAWLASWKTWFPAPSSPSSLTCGPQPSAAPTRCGSLGTQEHRTQEYWSG